MLLPDVQSYEELRGITLDKVGVSNLHYPLKIKDKIDKTRYVTARLDIFVGLHSQQRGAHFSRLISILNNYKSRTLSLNNWVRLLKDIRKSQDEGSYQFDSANIRASFMYFIEKTAPESKIVSPVGYDCSLEVSLDPAYKRITVNVPVSTVCPCSQAISQEGAHNQRGIVTVTVQQELNDKRIIWIEDLIAIIEQSASSDVYTLLRREDEKYITEKMFSHPTFVEDVVRNTVIGLKDNIKDIHYSVKCESFESIHPHNAYAEVSGTN
ncbi:MAG: GTP cyclohydrolase I FolE2 [Dehalococcoidales bacterium]|nr:GTP cyclohydrolase I FolE2 [Dehalococcoidales bacterium]